MPDEVKIMIDEIKVTADEPKAGWDGIITPANETKTTIYGVIIIKTTLYIGGGNSKRITTNEQRRIAGT
jgi:hypothetical protein